MPEAHHKVVSFSAFHQEGVVVEPQVPALQVGFAGSGFGRNETRTCNIDDHPVEVGQLLPLCIHAVKVRVALEDETLRGSRGDALPGLQRRQVRVIKLVLVSISGMKPRPVADTGLLDHCIKFVFSHVACMKLLEVMRRGIDVKRPCTRKRREKEGIGRRPVVPDRMTVDDLYPGRLTVDQKGFRGAKRREEFVERHVFPVISEVFGGKGLAVRPAVSGPKMKGERLVSIIVDLERNIRLKAELGCKSHQACITINREHPGIFAARHQQGDIPAGPPRLAAHRGEVGHHGCLRQPFSGRR